MAKLELYDYLFKITLIGDVGVGKVSINERYCKSVFREPRPTFHSRIPIDFRVRTIDLDGKRIKLQLWNTTARAQYRWASREFYRKALGIVVVYDVTNEESFNSITNWIRNAEEHAPIDVERIIIGNKCDMRERKVERERGENLAREHGFLFFETSAKENINVEEAIEFLVRSIKAKVDANPGLLEDTDPRLPKPSTKKKRRPSFRSSCSLF